MDLANKEVVFDLDAAAFSSDDFRMFQFKVKRCPRARPHDWTQCPFAHPGEKAKRRDPRKYRYSGTACPEFRRNGCCRRGDACPFAHGVFECWLHPSRYRTQMCTDGSNCKRRVCFFAHTESELRKPDEDPLWFQQQIQQELAAEQHVQQQMQALKVFANILGSNSSTLGGGQQAGAGQQPGLDMLKNLPSSTLSQSLGALGQGAQAGHLQAGSGDGLLQLLQLVEQQQQQQQQASAAAVTAQQSPLAPAASAPANLASLLSAVTSATGPGGGLVCNGGSAAVGNGTSQDIQLKLAQQLLHQTQQSQQQQASGTLTQEGLQARLTAQLAGLSLQQQQQQQAAKTAEAEAKQQQQQQAQLQANFALEFLNMLASQQQHVQAQQQQAVQLQQAQQQQAAQQQAAQQQLAQQQQQQQQQHLAAAAAAALASASHQQAQQAAVAAQQQAANGAAASASSALAARQQLAALGIDLQAFGLSPDMLGAHLADAGGIPQAPSAAAAPDTMSLLAAALQGSFGGPNPTRKDCSQPSQNAQSQGGGGGTAQAAAASPSPSGMDPLTALLAAAAGQSGGVPGIPQAMLNSLQGMLGQLSMSTGSGAMMPPPQPLTTSPAVAQQPQPQQPLMQSASTSNPMVLPPLMERSSTSTASDPDGTPTSAPAPLASVASSCVPAGSEGSASSAPDSPPPVAPVTAPLQAQPQVPHMPSVSAQNNAALSALAAAVGAGGSAEGNAALATFLAVYNKPEMLLTAQSLIERMAGAASTGGIGANGMMDGAAMAAALAGVASSASAPSQPPASSGGGGSSATLSGAEDGGGALRALG